MRRRHLSEAELTEYVDGELHPRRAADAEEHIRHCESCAAVAAGLRSAAAAVGSLRSVAVPGDLRARVARRLAQDLAAQITCRQAAPLIHQHLDSCLSPKAELQLQGHLRSCARCRADLAALASAARLVRSLPALEAPARVREAVSAAQRLRTLRFPRIARWRPALAAALAAAAVGVLVLLRPVGDQAPPSGPIRMAEPQAVFAPAATEVASLTDAAAEAQPGGTLEQPLEPTTPEAGPTRRAEKPTTRPPVPITVACAAKGPAPARTTPQSPEPEIELPSALQALRMVANTASHGPEGRRAMELAGERFATMHSESVWARLPSLPALGTGAESVPPAQPLVAPPASGDRPEEIGGLGVPKALPSGVRRLVGVGSPLV